MKRIMVLLVVMVMVLGFTVPSHADLTILGTDSLGNRLIYDPNLGVTWYDYTKSAGTWSSQVSWASNLTVNYNGQSIGDWRLPTISTATAGYNITSSEMGHLYYTELGNLAPYDTTGKSQTGWGLKNTGPFQHLVASGYWSADPTDTANISANAPYFYFSNGYQNVNVKTASYLALAVHQGDVAPVPIPGTFGLLGSGLAGIAAWSRMFRRRYE